jgi:hypothetical protein
MLYSFCADGEGLPVLLYGFDQLMYNNIWQPNSANDTNISFFAKTTHVNCIVSALAIFRKHGTTSIVFQQEINTIRGNLEVSYSFGKRYSISLVLDEYFIYS